MHSLCKCCLDLMQASKKLEVVFSAISATWWCTEHLSYPGLFKTNESRCSKYFRLTAAGLLGKTRRSGWRRRVLGPRRSHNFCIWDRKMSVTTLNSNRPTTLIHSTPPMLPATTTTTWTPWSNKLLARFPLIPWLVWFYAEESWKAILMFGLTWSAQHASEAARILWQLQRQCHHSQQGVSLKKTNSWAISFLKFHFFYISTLWNTFSCFSSTALSDLHRSRVSDRSDCQTSVSSYFSDFIFSKFILSH